MNELLNQLNFSPDENFSIGLYMMHISACAVLLFILSKAYQRFGNAISNRTQLGSVLILVGVTTFIIISIVKSSLALSLGLVGALSIVRFRTAIKEPEELAYFFMAISIGLGAGAYQLLATVLGFAVLLILIVLLSRTKINERPAQNLLIRMAADESQRSSVISNVSKIVTEYSSRVDLKRLKYGEGQLNANFLVQLNSIDSINGIQEKINSIDNNADITFLSADGR